MPRWEALRTKSKHLALYMLQLCRRIMKFSEKWIPKVHSKSSKTGVAGRQRLKFYDLGSFGMRPFSAIFWSGKESTRNLETYKF